MEFAQKALIFDSSGRVLLVARLTSAGNFVSWELPGGRVEPNENLDEGFMREIWEEVGLDIIVGPPVHLWSWGTDSGGQIVAVARMAYPKSGHLTEVNRVDGDNLGEIQWFTIGQLNAIAIDDGYREAISLAIVLRGRFDGQS